MLLWNLNFISNVDTELAVAKITEDTESDGMSLEYNGMSATLKTFSGDADSKSKFDLCHNFSLIIILILIRWLHYYF